MYKKKDPDKQVMVTSNEETQNSNPLSYSNKDLARGSFQDTIEITQTNLNPLHHTKQDLLSASLAGVGLYIDWLEEHHKWIYLNCLMWWSIAVYSIQ